MWRLVIAPPSFHVSTSNLKQCYSPLLNFVTWHEKHGQSKWKLLIK